MSAEINGNGQDKPKNNLLGICAEIGLWGAILMLIAAAGINGYSDIVKLKGEGPAIETLMAYSNFALYGGVALAAVSVPFFLLKRASNPEAAA